MAEQNTANEIFNPNAHLVIPSWINEEYFEKIITEDIPNCKRITKFTPIAATAPGENYTSIMVRVLLELELKDGSSLQKSYILKTELGGTTEAMQFLNNMCLFPKERIMYQDILPQLQRLYKEAGAEIALGPQCLQIAQTPEYITLVMEDLSQKNFANMDRLQGLDMPHITAVLHKLAELHAATALYYELNGPYDPMFDITFYTDTNRHIFQAMEKSQRELHQKAMREWGLENVEYYISNMPSMEKVFDAGKRINQPDPSEFNVLNHGDCWSNNIMFKHDANGEILETLFVDFQICKWGSPAQDLWYVITTSAALDIKIKEFDHFIYIYHKRLTECLQLLKYPKQFPTLRDIHIMMIKYGHWGPLTANTVMTAVMMPSDKDSNMENLIKEGADSTNFKYRTLTNPYYSRAMRQLYPFFHNKGLLDY